MSRHDDDLRDDPFEHALRQGLHHSVPSPMGAQDQLERLRPRFVRAQRRRTAIAGVVAAAAIGLVLVGIGSLTREQSTVVTPAGVTPTPSLPPVPSTTMPPVASGAVSTMPPTTVPPAGAGATRVPWAAPNNVATPPAGPTATVAPTPSTTVPSAPRIIPLAAAGGTVVVRLDGATVTLVSSAPAGGWSTTETRTDNGQVEVRFARSGSSDQSRIEARVDNGQLRTVTE